MLCAYDKFLAEGYISKEQFFAFGLRETIYAPIDKAEAEWKNLKRLVDENEVVFIRGFGRQARNTHMYLDLYEKVFKNFKVKIDPTNNSRPRKLIRELTGYVHKKNIQNYQVSHIFGHTKNIYAFAAPWNIVYTPKILDPFTGHEAKGPLADEYRGLFRKQSYELFKPFIEDFNQIVSAPDLSERLKLAIAEIEKGLEEKDAKKFRKSVEAEFKPITL